MQTKFYVGLDLHANNTYVGREIGLIMKMYYAAVSAMSRRFAEEIEIKKESGKLWKRLIMYLAERQL